MTQILADRMAAIEELALSSGSHKAFEHGLCVMEAVSYIAGEPWSDQPQCACPVITAFLISWNDSLPDDDRTRLLKPLIPLIVGTRSTKKVEERRSYMALDWLIRVHTPKWLDLVPSLSEHAKAMRDLDEIVDMAGATAAGEISRAAGDAARAAARATAWAAWDAAWAAWDAAGDAARAAARATAMAAWDAGASALRPTTEWLQASAVDLVKRMCEVKA